jgi:acyl transferase domain-containing protein
MFLGIGSAVDWGHLRRDAGAEPGVFDGHGSDGGAAAGRVSYLFGLKGPCFSVNTACSSSLVAVDAAHPNLRLGTCERAVAAGVCLHLHVSSFVVFCALHALSHDGMCKTFDSRADGYGRSECCGSLVLEHHSQGMLITIVGTAVNQDGKSASFMAPHGPSQETVIRAAMKQIGKVHNLEAHGTGTALGDPIEMGAIQRTLGYSTTRAEPLV